MYFVLLKIAELLFNLDTILKLTAKTFLENKRPNKPCSIKFIDF